jgi:hypothetical protein
MQTRSGLILQPAKSVDQKLNVAPTDASLYSPTAQSVGDREHQISPGGGF